MKTNTFYAFLENISRTTWKACAYHQWYAYHRLGTPGLERPLRNLVDLEFIPLVESYQKTLKNGIHSFPTWRLAFSGGCGEQAGKFACFVLAQDT